MAAATPPLAAPRAVAIARPSGAGLATAAAFLVLFAQPLRLLASDWWTNPDAGHGLLLFPLALWLGWKRGWAGEPRPAKALGTLLLVGAILLRYLSGLAAELFTMRVAALAALVGLVLYFRGTRQLRAWWLPLVLLALSIPLPTLITNTLALPLQFKASQMGAALLAARHVPVRLAGNVILLPGHKLFVTEACSGLRSLTALLSLGVLLAGLWLRSPGARTLVVLAAIPVAIGVNAVRVFLTGFLVYFVSPELGTGFMHLTEGWLLFLVSFGTLAGLTWAAIRVERALRRRPGG